jgi:hypothetical protein
MPGKKSTSSKPNPLQIAAEVIKCQEDLQYHLEKYVYIKDKKGALRPIGELTRPQKMLLSLIHHIQVEWKSQGFLVRILALKTRKTGFSTLEACRQLLQVFQHAYESMIIAQDLPTASYIFEILKRTYDHYTLPKPVAQRSNKREIKFKDTEGYIEVFTANQVAATRGRTPQIIHGSEVAWWEKGSEAAVGLFQAIAREPNTTVILETTAHGEDLLFKPMWDKAQEGVALRFRDDPDAPYGLAIDLEILNEDEWNGYFPLFISAMDDEACYEEVTDDEAARIMQTLDADEVVLHKRFGVKPGFIKWLRKCLRYQCQGLKRIRQQEYPITPEEAFVVSGDPRFDVEALNEMDIEVGKRGYLTRSDKWNREVTFKEDRFEKLVVFRRPQPGHRYVIGVDTAEGILPEGASDPDESVASVFDIDNGPSIEQVAILAGQLSEEYMVEPCALLAEWYNMAYIVPEWTGGHGEHLSEGLAKKYPTDRIYHAMRAGRTSEKMGLTIGANRHQLITDLAEAIAERQIQIRDRGTIQQCKTFVWSRRGRVEASAGHHDDRVFAVIGAVHGWQFYPRSIKPSDGSLAGFGEELVEERWPLEDHMMSSYAPDEGGY